MDTSKLSVSEVKKISLEIKKHFGNEEPTPEQILSIARDHNSPLHPFIEWDDKKAAKAYRLSQATQLIKVVVWDDRQVRENRPYSYVRLTPNQNDKPYFSTDEVGESFEDQILPAALSDLRLFKERYKNLPSLEPVYAAIEQIEKEYESEESKVKAS